MHSRLDTRVRVHPDESLAARWEGRKDANPLKIRHCLVACTDPEWLGKRIAFISAAARWVRRCFMSTADTEFLRLLKKDVDYFERAVERFEELVPRVSAPIQDQWRLQATVRRNFAMELEILLDKAEASAAPRRNKRGQNDGDTKHSDSAPY